MKTSQKVHGERKLSLASSNCPKAGHPRIRHHGTGSSSPACCRGLRVTPPCLQKSKSPPQEEQRRSRTRSPPSVRILPDDYYPGEDESSEQDEEEWRRSTTAPTGKKPSMQVLILTRNVSPSTTDTPLPSSLPLRRVSFLLMGRWCGSRMLVKSGALTEPRQPVVSVAAGTTLPPHPPTRIMMPPRACRRFMRGLTRAR
jgi:hypothetical protein